jgi:hypothetical protein
MKRVNRNRSSFFFLSSHNNKSHKVDEDVRFYYLVAGLSLA